MRGLLVSTVGMLLALGPTKHARAQSLNDLPPDRIIRVRLPPPEPPPFKLGLELGRGLLEDGDLAYPGQTSYTVGLRFVFMERRAIRQHLTVAHHWERHGPTSRRGFRIDLLALGFPIPLWAGRVNLALEPILRVIRTEVLFTREDEGPSRFLFRLQSGFSLALTAEYRNWFVAVEPLSIDFRYLMLAKDQTFTGFSRIWSLALTVGKEL